MYYITLKFVEVISHYLFLMRQSKMPGKKDSWLIMSCPHCQKFIWTWRTLRNMRSLDRDKNNRIHCPPFPMSVRKLSNFSTNSFKLFSLLLQNFSSFVSFSAVLLSLMKVCSAFIARLFPTLGLDPSFLASLWGSLWRLVSSLSPQTFRDSLNAYYW